MSHSLRPLLYLLLALSATFVHAQTPQWMRSPGNADGTVPQSLGSNGKFLDAVMDSQGRTYAAFYMTGSVEFLGDTIPWPDGVLLPAEAQGQFRSVALVCFDTGGQMIWSRSMGLGSNFGIGHLHFMFDENEQLLASLTTNYFGFWTSIPGLELIFPDTTVTWPMFTAAGQYRNPVFRINTADGTFSEVLFTRTGAWWDSTFDGKPMYRHGKFFMPSNDREVHRLDMEGNLEMHYKVEAWPPGTTVTDFEVLPDTSVVLYGHTMAGAVGLRTMANSTNVWADPAPGGTWYSLWAARASAAGEVLWIRAYCHTDPTDHQRGAEQIRLLPDGNLLLTALHIEPTTFAGVTYGLANQLGMTKWLLLRIDPDGNEVSGLQLTNSLALPGGFTQDVSARRKSWVVPMADGSIQFAHHLYGAVGLNGIAMPGLGQFSRSMVMGKVSPGGDVVAADFVENAQQNPRLLVHGSRSVLLANHANGSNTYRTLCLPNVAERQSVVMVVDHSEPKPVPVAEFTVQYLDRDGGMVRFNNTSTNGNTYTWVYGDNSPNGTLHSPVKGYNGGQNYSACLTAANMCGSAQACDNVVLGAPYALRPPSGVQHSTAQLVISDLARAITTGTQFALVRTGMENIPLVNVLHSTTDAATSGGQQPFHTWSGAADLTDAPLGVWSLRIARPGQPADTLHAAFSVLANTGSQIGIISLGFPSVLEPDGRRHYRMSAAEVMRGGRAAQRDGYLVYGTGETPVGIPVISTLPYVSNLTRFYQPAYDMIRPTHAGYTDLDQFRQTNGLLLASQGGHDYVVSQGRAVRFHLLPHAQEEIITAHAPGFGPESQKNLQWRNEHYALQPVFGSDVLAGGGTVRNMIGLGQYLRLAAQDVLGMALGTPGCAPCFTQAEEQVMAIYATDISLLPPVDRRFSFGLPPQIYDLREVAADVLARSMQINCVASLSTSSVNGALFQEIMDRAMERMMLSGRQNPCLPPVQPGTPGGSALGSPYPPIYPPILVRTGSGSHIGPVTGAIPVTNPVATPPVAGLPQTWWAPFEGAVLGDGTIVGTVTTTVNGEKVSAPIKVTEPCALGSAQSCVIPPPPGGKVQFDGETQHLDVEVGTGFYNSYIDPDQDAVKDILAEYFDGLASLELAACVMELTDPAFTTGMTAQQVEDKWNECMRAEYERGNSFYAPYVPGDLTDLPSSAGFWDIPPSPNADCSTQNGPFIRGTAPFPHFGDVAFDDSFAAYNCSYDPNEKTGPGDNEEEIWVRPDHEFIYAISFENLPEATAPAQEVHIFDQLDTAFFDLSTVRITRSSVGMGTTFQPDSMPGATQMRDMRPGIDAHLLLETHMDVDGLLRWGFTALDTDGLQPITDGLGGFLPPNDTTGAGCGQVTFRVRLKENAAQGEFINNQASIVFDVNEPILTQVWRNKVDGIKPWSEVEELPAVIYTQQFNVDWQVGDSIGVVRHLELWVSVDGAPYHKIGHMEGSSVQITGAAGHHYRFYTIAVDMAGNREEIPANGFDAETTIDESVSVGEEPTTASVGMLCFPNPTTDQLTLVLGEVVRGQQAMVHDAQGRLVHTQRLAGASTVLRTGHLAPGTYAITVVDPDGKRGSVRFVKE